MKVLLWLVMAAILSAVACGQAATPATLVPVPPTPNLEATVKAGVQATVAALVVPTIAPDPTRHPRVALVPTPVPTKIPTPPSPLSQDRVVVQVVRVIDGDTIEVVFNDGAVDTVRLLGIDTPRRFPRTSPMCTAR